MPIFKPKLVQRDINTACRLHLHSMYKQPSLRWLPPVHLYHSDLEIWSAFTKWPCNSVVPHYKYCLLFNIHILPKYHTLQLLHFMYLCGYTSMFIENFEMTLCCSCQEFSTSLAYILFPFQQWTATELVILTTLFR